MKYKVTINWHGEQIIMFTHANKPSVALKNACIRLAESLGVYNSKVLSYINRGTDCYNVEEVCQP